MVSRPDFTQSCSEQDMRVPLGFCKIAFLMKVPMWVVGSKHTACPACTPKQQQLYLQEPLVRHHPTGHQDRQRVNRWAEMASLGQEAGVGSSKEVEQVLHPAGHALAL